MPATPSPLDLSRPRTVLTGRGRDNSALLLLLLDSRAPAGGHNHSAGMESAIAAGLVHDLADVESFCRARLQTSGRVAASFAAAAAALVADDLVDVATAGEPTEQITTAARWAALDAEFDARTPSEAVRAASRQLGNGLRRLIRAVLPAFQPPWLDLRPAPHHPLVLGAAIAAAGGTPLLAARAAALNAVSAPASAAVRLLGLDPFATQAMLAHLAGTIDADGPEQAFGGAASGRSAPAALPMGGLPALDLLADFHLTTEVRLFAS